MKNERILHADDQAIAHEGFKAIIESFGSKDGQKIVGSAFSVEEVEKLMAEGLRPTAAFIDNSLPKRGDGERAAAIVRKFSPETVIVSLSSDDQVKWGDYNIPKLFSSSDLAEFILNLKHE
jgi:DNA-binding NarL/FixJ family response regulator